MKYIKPFLSIIILIGYFIIFPIATGVQTNGSKISQQWIKNIDLESSYVSPIILDNTVLIFRDIGPEYCPMLHLLYSLNKNTGEEVWRYPKNTKGNIYDYTTSGDTLYYLLNNTTISYSITSKSDKPPNQLFSDTYFFCNLREFFEDDSPRAGGLTVTKNDLYVYIDNKLLSFDKDSKKLKHQVRVEYGNPKYYWSDDRNLIFGWGDNNITSYNIGNNIFNWTFTDQRIEKIYSPYCLNDSIIIYGLTSEKTTFLASINIETGSLEWFKEENVNKCYVHNETLFVEYCKNGKNTSIATVDAKSGNINNIIPSKELDFFILGFSDDTMYVYRQDKRNTTIYAYSYPSINLFWKESFDVALDDSNHSFDGKYLIYQDDDCIKCYLILK